MAGSDLFRTVAPCGHANILAMWKLRPAVLFLAIAASLPAASKLEIFCIDVEGGKATLWVSPSGESMLMDSGYGGFNSRDADRIAAAAKAGGVKKIDYLVISHFHADHAGGVVQLAEKLPIKNFIDHGLNSETGQAADTLYGEYKRIMEKGTHIVAKPGDKLPIKGMEVHFVSSDTKVLTAPLAGAGQPNPDCAGTKRPEAEITGENPHSIGVVVSYGTFRAVDLGDLTATGEYDLVCPANKLGTATLLMSAHHGTGDSNSKLLVNAVRPQVAIMDNGARKGGTAAAWDRIHGVAGLKDLWQLHYSLAAGKEHNSPDTFVANVDENCEGKYIKVTVEKDGVFTISNQRNKFERTYGKK